MSEYITATLRLKRFHWRELADGPAPLAVSGAAQNVLEGKPHYAIVSVGDTEEERAAYIGWEPHADPTVHRPALAAIPIPYDLYWCPSCGWMATGRYRRDDLIGSCWGPCLEKYGEPIPITFVRGVGRGAPQSGCVF